MRAGRRTFLKSAIAAAVAGVVVGGARAEEPLPKRKFTVCLACGMIGIKDDPAKVIEWAREYGFEAIEPSISFLQKLSASELADYLARMREAKLVWGAAGLPVQFKGDDGPFQADLKSLPDKAKALQRAGVTRTATWLTPSHNSLTYVANFRLHARRLREVAKVLADRDLRLGLEYVGPKTSWAGRRFPFIHSMAEMKDLIAEIGRDNVGLLVDTWHWYTARETEQDLTSLRSAEIILVHMNDALPIPVDQQVDGRRALPCSTGVIDLKTFLTALVKIGYDGPVVCEPFSAELRGRPPVEVLAAVSASMKKAMALVE